jgi:superfamily II DNA/RNA helicase
VVGKLHQLSAGLVTGGRKEFEGEQERIVKMNILVATPGRLLQVSVYHTLSVPDRTLSMHFGVEGAVAM